MRIWMINHYAYAPYHSAGTRHYSLARELVKRGHQVSVFSSSFYHKSRKQTFDRSSESWHREVIDNVNFVWIRSPSYAGNGLDRLWNMIVYAWRACDRNVLRHQGSPDIVIGSSPDLFAALAAERVAKRYGIPFLLEVRDLWPETLVDLGNFSRFHPLILVLGRIEKHLYRRARRILSVLPNAVDYMVEKGATRQHVTWLPNGVLFDERCLTRHFGNSSRQVFMYAGAHGLYNNLHIILYAAKILEEKGLADRFLIRLVGDGPYKLTLKRMASELKLQTVVFERPIPKTEIYQLLQEADAFLMILKDSNVFKWGISPNKLFDYMVVGRPVVFAVNSSNNPIRDCEGGVTVDPNDPKSLAGGIKDILDQPFEVRRVMGQRAREYVQKFHNISVLAERLETILTDVIASTSYKSKEGSQR